MKVVSKLKNPALVFIMLVFAAVVMLGGVAVGDEQSNVPESGLKISKAMTSGETTVYTNTKESWTLEIAVSYGYGNYGTELPVLVDAVVSDTLPEEISLDSITVSKGSVSTSTKSEATKLTWTIGTMGPSRVTETLTMDVSTKTESSGGRMGRTTQYFLEAGEHVLNRGASVSGTEVGPRWGPGNFDDDLGTVITAGPTDLIIVYAEKRMGRMAGGMGGRWR